jgi:ketosteroid isomerase-like protein
MRLTATFAEDFARTWVTNWNDRDIERILSHYSDEIIFHSPRIARVTSRQVASLFGKAALQDYWSEALAHAPELFFELDDILVGSDALTILYTNHREERVAETMIFAADGLVIRAVAAYR